MNVMVWLVAMASAQVPHERRYDIFKAFYRAAR